MSFCHTDICVTMNEMYIDYVLSDYTKVSNSAYLLGESRLIRHQ